MLGVQNTMRYFLIIITLFTIFHVLAQGEEVDSARSAFRTDPLKISAAELFFKINFLNKPTAEEIITVSARDADVTIASISKRAYIKITINNKPVSLPFTIKANTSVPLKIIVAPTSATYQPQDTLTVFIADSDTPYNIFLNIDAYHADLQTIRSLRSLETLRSVKLSKSKDKYLILPSMGTITGATITSMDGKTFSYDIKETTKIDLSVFAAGVYRLHVSSCDGSGQLFLEVTN
jgi:hypothetical protein